MRFLLSFAKCRCRGKNIKSPDTTPEELVKMWADQDKLCAACKEPLLLLESCMDHNHETGEVRGFIHHKCNLVEGYTKDLSDDAFENWYQWAKSIRKIST